LASYERKGENSSKADSDGNDNSDNYNENNQLESTAAPCEAVKVSNNKGKVHPI